MSHLKNYAYLIEEAFDYKKTLGDAIDVAKTENKQIDKSANIAGDALAKRKDNLVKNILNDIKTNYQPNKLSSEGPLVNRIRQAYVKLFELFNTDNIGLSKPVVVNNGISIMSIYYDGTNISFVRSDSRASDFRELPIMLHNAIFTNMSKSPGSVVPVMAK